MLNILLTHVSSSTHFSLFILLNSSRYFFHRRAVVVVAGPKRPLFTSHAMEAIKAIATIAGVLHPATPGRIRIRVCVYNVCDPVYKTIKRNHTFVPSKKLYGPIFDRRVRSRWCSKRVLFLFSRSRGLSSLSMNYRGTENY